VPKTRPACEHCISLREKLEKLERDFKKVCYDYATLTLCAQQVILDRNLGLSFEKALRKLEQEAFRGSELQEFALWLNRENTREGLR
jgi:hypothetical protein